MMTLHKRSILLVRLLMVLALCVAAALPAHAYTVVIDAGHGGKDHGAIDNNVREKDINLGVALKVAKLLRKHHKDLKVVLTRDKDEYLTLQQRADIANKAKGDLFISIHTNSVAESNPNRTTVAGASTYTLGLHKDAANMDVARRENSVMTYESNYDTKYAGFDPNSDESYIIFEMAQKSNMAQSVKFANAVQQQMAKVASRKDRGVHQAGFWVLWATSMPAALIELDFICNPNSAKYISSEQGQEKLAEAITNAVADYFKTLAKHEKERLRTEQTESRTQQDTPTLSDDVVVLAAVATTDKKSTEAPAVTPAERTRRPATRRRRSEAAREKSQQQEYEVAVLPEQVQYVAEVPEPVAANPEPAQAPSQQPATAKSGKKQSKAKQAKQEKQPKADKKSRMASHRQAPGTRTVGGKTVYVVSNQPTTADSQEAPAAVPAKSDKAEKEQAVAAANSKVTAPTPKATKKKNAETDAARTSPVRLARVNTVYKIQIYSCDKVLKEKDPLFGGLYPVTCSKTGDNLYTYYYGESQSQGEIYRLLSDVQKVFPEAKVVKARRQ